MSNSDEFRQLLVAAIPRLRAFSLSLTSRSATADDLVQEALLKAWKHQDSFKPGTNLRAWLFTILRNEFYSQLRKRKREVEDVDDLFSSRVSVLAEQHGHLEMAELRSALDKLPQDQREAIVLVGASGFSYEEAAEICNVAVGTIKSRVNRARAKLASLLQFDSSGPAAGAQDVPGASGRLPQ
jgi:RNA polymerase sigma-70 factor, ECF subfamily